MKKRAEKEKVKMYNVKNFKNKNIKISKMKNMYMKNVQCHVQCTTNVQWCTEILMYILYKCTDVLRCTSWKSAYLECTAKLSKDEQKPPQKIALYAQKARCTRCTRASLAHRDAYRLCAPRASRISSPVPSRMYIASLYAMYWCTAWRKVEKRI